MAAETELETLIIRLTGDGTEYQKMLKDAESTTTQATAAMTSSVQGLASSITQAFAVLGAKSLMQEAFAGFAEAEGIELKLRAALEANGREVESTMALYEDFANALQDVTTEEDDHIKAMLAKAEAFDLTGDKAKSAIKDAVSLAAVVGGEADSYIRVTAALAKGDVATAQRFARMIPQLRGIRDQTEFVAKATKLMETGWKTAQAEANSSAGVIKQLKVAYGNLLEEFGKIIAEGVRPVVGWLKKLVEMFQKLDDQSKRVIVYLAAAATAFLAIGPALAVARALMGPFVSMLTTLIGLGGSLGKIFVAPLTLLTTALGWASTAVGVLVSAVTTLLSPVGLILAMLTALAAVVVYAAYEMVDWGGVLDWFSAQWDTLMEHVKPAIQGIKDAIAAGDILLAFKILWAQVKLSFLTAIQPLRKEWAIFVNALEVAWTDMSTRLREIWGSTTNYIMMGLLEVKNLANEYINLAKMTAVDLQLKQGIIDKDEWFRQMAEIQGEADKQKEAWKSTMAKILTDAENLEKKLAAAREAALTGAGGGVSETVTKLEKELNDLMKSRDRLVADAAAKAAKVLGKDADGINLPDMEKSVKESKNKDAERKDAALFRSAEARMRIEDYNEKTMIGLLGKAVDHLAKMADARKFALVPEALDLEE